MGPSRAPDEILTDLDTAQGFVSCLHASNEPPPLRSLLWEVIDDLLDSLEQYKRWDFTINGRALSSQVVVVQCVDMLKDYAANHYGDD